MAINPWSTRGISTKGKQVRAMVDKYRTHSLWVSPERPSMLAMVGAKTDPTTIVHTVKRRTPQSDAPRISRRKVKLPAPVALAIIGPAPAEIITKKPEKRINTKVDEPMAA